MSGGEPADPARDRRHYSYAHYADPAVAAAFDRARFGGPIGALLGEAQERILLDAIDGRRGPAIVDVGTGTGRAALALARAGGRVTGLDASREMLAVAGARAAEAGVPIRLGRADAHALPLGDRSVDVAVSLRVLMHAPDWRRCLAELCRVSAWRVVVDFPAAGSLAALESLARRARARAGGHVEAYRVLRERQVVALLRAAGYRPVRWHRQFVLPIALHKAIGSRGLTVAVERALAAVGLLRLCGSPVTVVAER